jgi:hypothetical protein
VTFEAGKSGNPTGARKTKEMRDALRVILKDIDAGLLQKPRNNMDAIVRAHVTKALEGDMAAIKEIYDRIDGKVAQAIVGDDEEAAIRIDGLALLLQAVDGKTRSV